MLRLISFIRAMWWLARYGESATHIQRGRQSVCESCPEMVQTKTGLFCKACRCPHWFMADIRTKTRIKRLSCPLDKW